VAVGLSQEVLDVNFNVLLVRAARVSGRVLKPDGTPATSGNVNLVAENSSTGPVGPNLSARIQGDGAFSIANVAPGRYVLRARGNDGDTPQYAFQPISMAGADLDTLTVMLSPAATIAGIVTFQPGTTAPPDVTQLRITAPATDQGSVGPQPNVRVNNDGRFTLAGVPAGSHLIRTNGNTRGWMLKAVNIGGRDLIDTPLVVRSGESVSGVELVFSDRVSEISGTIANEQGTPVADYTVLAFATDRSLWRAQSRQIATARPDQTGTYRIRGLPPGEYYLTTVDPAEQGEWFEAAYLDEHRAGAVHVVLGEGDVKNHDFRIRNLELGIWNGCTNSKFRIPNCTIHRSPQRNCSTLMAAIGTASARKVLWPSRMSRTPAACAAVHSCSVHPPSGPISTAASDGARTR
jgi:hypothetical protein